MQKFGLCAAHVMKGLISPLEHSWTILSTISTSFFWRKLFNILGTVRGLPWIYNVRNKR